MNSNPMNGNSCIAMDLSADQSTKVDLSLPSDSTSAIMATLQLAKEIGFSNQDQTLLAIVASELATNIIRYAKTGSVTIQAIRNNSLQGIEIIAEDNGPGIENVELALSEHYSSGDGLGLGLPSVKRIMDEFSIDSGKNIGTLITTRKWKHKKEI